jgi:hypothetical protein
VRIVKAKAGEVADSKKGGFNAGSNSANLNSSIVTAARDMIKGCNQLGGTINRSIFQQRIGQIIEARGFHVGGSSVTGGAVGMRRSMAFAV